jgi:type I restriction-modification system DNA methylase subunit
MKDDTNHVQSLDQDIKSAPWDAANTLRGSALSHGLEGLHHTATLLHAQLMDQAIHNKITFFKIRRKLLDDGHIDTVIGLPANLFYSTGIQVCISS